MDNFIHEDFTTDPSPWVSPREFSEITVSQPRHAPWQPPAKARNMPITLWDVPQKEDVSNMCWNFGKIQSGKEKHWLV
jgi:hypothetical protein